MNLLDVFSSIAYKRIVAVDLPNRGSHQHELNGCAALRTFFRTDEKITGEISWHYFSDDEEPLNAQGSFTFYDARARSAARTGRCEWRMYYSGNFLDYANSGDILIFAKTSEGVIHGLVIQENSRWLTLVCVLFDLQEIRDDILIVDEELSNRELEFSRAQILEELGIEVSYLTQPQDEEIARNELTVAQQQGIEFPTTRRMSELAQTLVQIDPNDADTALISWLEREERLFRMMEKILVQQKLDRGFDSVDDFISYSLSVQNRRKSRMGYALQNHLARIFCLRGLRFETQKITEGKNRPDFLFPGSREYHDETFDQNRLIMLAAKSSCKERWRQILTEAKKINSKHLCTLEQAISRDQTREMMVHNVNLVLPRVLLTTYSEEQQQGILTISEFIKMVRSTQQ